VGTRSKGRGAIRYYLLRRRLGSFFQHSCRILRIFFVDLRGIEPLTSSLRTRRATNCATGPYGPNFSSAGSPANERLCRLLTSLVAEVNHCLEKLTSEGAVARQLCGVSALHPG
jgi:hypothetical protein